VHLRKTRYLSSAIASIAGAGLTLGAVGATGAAGQAPSQGTSTAAAPILAPYTAPDKSAQAGVPPGWKVAKGADTVVVLNGPQGEAISLGLTFVVRNAAFQPGQPASGGVDLWMPNSASLSQKFTMLEQHGAAANGAPDPEVKIASDAPIQLSFPNVQCGRVTGTFISRTGPVGFGLLMCSLPVDVGGTYKVMMKLAQAPPAIAAQEKAMASAVFASYRVAPAMLRRKLAPHNSPPPPPMPMGVGGGSGMPSMPGYSPNDPIQNGCFDLAVIREEPNWRLPRRCGGDGPDD
jgi:hypothetical protein